MNQQGIDPKTLADQLDEILPANSGIILESAIDDSRLHLAKLLAAYSNEVMSEQGHDLVQEQLMLALDNAESSSWRRGSPRLLLSVASLILFAGCALVFAVIGIPDPVTETLSGFFGENETSAAEITEELLVSATATEEIVLTATPEPTEVVSTEQTATEIPTVIPVIVEPTATFVPVTAYVQADVVNVRDDASTSSEIVATTELNEAVQIISLTDDETWSQVELNNGTIGWIVSDLLAETQTQQAVDNTQNDGDNNPPPRNGDDNPPPPNGNGGGGRGGNGGGGRGNGGGGNGGGGGN